MHSTYFCSSTFDSTKSASSSPSASAMLLGLHPLTPDEPTSPLKGILPLLSFFQLERSFNICSQLIKWHSLRVFQNRISTKRRGSVFIFLSILLTKLVRKRTIFSYSLHGLDFCSSRISWNVVRSDNCKVCSRLNIDLYFQNLLLSFKKNIRITVSTLGFLPGIASEKVPDPHRFSAACI